MSKARILYDACPLCASKKFAEVKRADCTKHALYTPLIGTVMVWNQCAACTHIFAQGYFTDEAAAAVFSKTHDNQKTGFDLEHQRPISAHMVEKVLPYVQSGEWLDVGFGNASLLFTAQEYGFTPVGIDLRQENVEGLKQLGIEAHGTDFLRLDHPQRYSVISMADVLEHMPYPKMGLNNAHTIMKKGGVLLISMPNADCMLWKALDMANANPYWQEIEHYHNFGRARLYALLRECGFEPVRYGISERYRACMEVVARKTG
jgi:2-polyprenyl-3-methyl-5-hydroxy-6-metoxy-1,4-benzoquinol methylase